MGVGRRWWPGARPEATGGWVGGWVGQGGWVGGSLLAERVFDPSELAISSLFFFGGRMGLLLLNGISWNFVFHELCLLSLQVRCEKGGGLAPPLIGAGGDQWRRR